MQIYVHIPFCKRKCNYCDFCSQTLGVEREYIDALIEEIKIQGQKYGDKVVDTIYFGGGTPSVLQEGMLKAIVNALELNFNLQTIERSIEGNPESLTINKLKEYRACGFDRVSMGVQSLDDNVLIKAGRLHNSKTAIEAINNAMEIFDNVSVDMMIGLPEQTMQSAVDTAQKLVVTGIKHISCYALILEDGTPLSKSVNDGVVKLPNEDDCADTFDEVMKILSSAGFLRYEVSNFAKCGFECRHNLGYWHRSEYLGLGAAAHSLIDNTRFCNVSNVNKYIESINVLQIKNNNFQIIKNELTNDEISFEKIMLGLRMTEGIPKSYFSGFEKQLETYSEYFVTNSNGNIALTKRGYEIMNTILCDFIKE
ncbi:MAG: radical SAM family heme chaperone HemW [Clostridia bacterium]|nr:radical SAM family heme chaperone HemW [Clostridia bacterium]